MNPNSTDMGILANTAEGKADKENGKHPGELVKWGAAMDAPIWGSLTTQVYFFYIAQPYFQNPAVSEECGLTSLLLLLVSCVIYTITTCFH